MNNITAPAAASAPATGAKPNMNLDGSEISKGYSQKPGGQSNYTPIGIDYNIFQGSADGATGNSDGTVGGTGGFGGAAGDGVGGVGGGFAGGPVRARRYESGGSVTAPAADTATSPEEAARRLRERYGDPTVSSTSTQPQSSGNPNDYIGQWAYDVGQGNISGMLEGPGMRALQKGDILSALSPGVMIGKSIGIFKADGGPINANQQMGQHLADQGRGRDTMLVHMSPAEVRGLGSLHPSGRMPINPNTGLPEADFLTDILPGIAGTVLGSFVGMPWLGAVAGGLGTWAATGNLGKGILSGLMSFGLGSIGGALGEAGKAAGEAASKGTTEAAKAAAASGALGDPFAQGAAQVGGASTQAASDIVSKAGQGVSAAQPQSGFFDSISRGFQNAPQTLSNIGQGFANPQNLNFSKLVMPAMMAGSGAYGLYSANQQPAPPPQPTMPQQMQAPPLTTAANPPRLPTGYNPPPGYGTSQVPQEGTFFQPNPAWGGYPSYASHGGQQRSYQTPDGGSYELAKGGVADLPSGMIRGPGAGMDDKIKGTIDGRRDVYLSDGEYVVDAQTISALGDGSSKAGAQRMKNIVEEIRQKKFGSKKQPPKMASLGGIASIG